MAMISTGMVLLATRRRAAVLVVVLIWMLTKLLLLIKNPRPLMHTVEKLAMELLGRTTKASQSMQANQPLDKHLTPQAISKTAIKQQRIHITRQQVVRLPSRLLRQLHLRMLAFQCPPAQTRTKQRNQLKIG